VVVIKLLLLALLVFQARHISAADYDFYLDFSECKLTVGYLVLSKESIKTLPGDPTTMACRRTSNIVDCDFIFKTELEGRKEKSERYEVVMDSPPLLILSIIGGSETIAINTSQHAAAVTSRIIREQFLGAKVCQGMYLTDFERKGLRK